MNKSHHRLIFNASRGSMMAVAETASSSSKSPSDTSKSRRKSSKCCKSAKSDEFTLSNAPPAQWIRVQAAPDLGVFCNAQKSESGFLSGGGFGITYGKREQSLDQKSQSTNDGRGNQIRYFTNTTASGDRRYEDYKNSSINAMPHTPPIDYVSIQGGGFGVGGNVSVNVLNQEVFVGGGKSTFSSVPGFSIVGGRMIDGPATQLVRSDAVSKMLDGGSFQGAVCAGGLCAGINQSIEPVGSNPPKALELGIGTPGVSGGVGAAVQLPASGGKK